MNLWALVKQNLSELPSATNLGTLKNLLKIVLVDINAGLLKDLVDGMPSGMRKGLKLGSGYIGIVSYRLPYVYDKYRVSQNYCRIRFFSFMQYAIESPMGAVRTKTEN